MRLLLPALPFHTCIQPKPSSSPTPKTKHKAAETRDRLAKNLIDLYIGQAVILPDSKRTKGEKGEVAVRVCRGKTTIDIPAHHVCIATGSRLVFSLLFLTVSSGGCLL